MGMFIDDQKMFGLGSVKSTMTGYPERVARKQADLFLADFRKGMDRLKALRRMKQRLAKVERNTNKKSFDQIQGLINTYIRQSDEFQMGQWAKKIRDGNKEPAIIDTGSGLMKMERRIIPVENEFLILK